MCDDTDMHTSSEPESGERAPAAGIKPAGGAGVEKIEVMEAVGRVAGITALQDAMAGPSAGQETSVVDMLIKGSGAAVAAAFVATGSIPATLIVAGVAVAIVGLIVWRLGCR